MLIKIISVPEGEAPLEIREAWVGLILPVSRGTGNTNPIRDFPVSLNDAVHVLELASKVLAAAFWSCYGITTGHNELLFKREECKPFPRLELSEVQRHIELSVFEGQHQEVPIDLLLRANHVLNRWLEAHGCTGITCLGVDSEILKPFWKLLAAYEIELTPKQKEAIVSSYNDD